MKNYFEELKKKLNKEIKLENIEIIDNSHLHKGHKFFSKEKFHLTLNYKIFIFKFNLKIKCPKISYEILKEDLQTKIHALEINIEQ